MTIPDWSALRAKLAQDLLHFHAASANGTRQALRRYALVDAAQVPELRSPEFLARPFEHISLFSLTKEHGIAKYGPLLIPIDDTPTSRANARVLHAMRHGWTVSWIGSTLPLSDLAQHLAGHLNGILSDGRDVLIRYYDPRLLPAFLTYLEAPTREALMAPIGHWAWWDRKMNFVMKEGGNKHISPGIVQTRISAETQKAMAVATMGDLIKGLVVDEADDDEFVKWLPQTLYTAVIRQLQSARDSGLKLPSDVQLFVSLALRVHPNFFSLLPVFSVEKERLSNGDVDMPTLVLAVKDHDWNRLGSNGYAALEQLRQSINQELHLHHDEGKGTIIHGK